MRQRATQGATLLRAPLLLLLVLLLLLLLVVVLLLLLLVVQVSMVGLLLLLLLLLLHLPVALPQLLLGLQAAAGSPVRGPPLPL